MPKRNNKTPKRKSCRVEQKSKRKPLYLTQQTSPKPKRTPRFKINLRKRDKKPTYKETDDTPQKPNPLSVYEFDEYEYASESSSTDDEDNSMRCVVKKLQQNYKKQPRRKILEAIKNKRDKMQVKPVKKQNGITIFNRGKNTKTETSTVQNKIEPDPGEDEEEVDVVGPAISNDEAETTMDQNKNNIDIDLIESTPPKKEMKQIEKQYEITVSPPDKNRKTETSTVENINNIVPNPVEEEEIDVVGTTISNNDISFETSKKLIEDLTQSFLEDDNNKLKIISDIVVRPADKEIPKLAKPWRMHVYSNKKLPYTFTYKNDSFTPRYEPDYNYKLTSDNNVETKQKKKPMYQTSITNFLKGEKPKIIDNNELFTEPQKQPKSPRKALTEINFVQSTPLKNSRNSTINISHDISAITNSPKNHIPAEKTNLFEQIKSSPIRKKTSPLQKKISPPKEINLTDDSVGLNEIPLFQEPREEPHMEVSKKSSHKYVRKYQKRKRLPSVEVDIEDPDTDAEIDVVDEPQKRKKSQRTKEEDLEADRLAKAYNSMFEEIEKHELIID